MNTLDLYIGRRIVSSFATALGALVAIFSVVNLTQELQEVGTGQYTFVFALWYVIMTLPSEMYEMFPAAALLGTVAALGTMASANEVVAINAAGISNFRIVGSAMRTAGVLLVTALLFGELAAAPLAQQASEDRSVAVSGGLSLRTARGLWIRDSHRFINVRNPLPDGRLRDVSIYEFDEERRLRQMIRADWATFLEGEWQLGNVRRSIISEDSVETVNATTETWDTLLTPEQMALATQPPEDLSIRELDAAIDTLRERGESPRHHELALWRRLSMPLVTAVMVFVGIPVVLTFMRGASTGQRIAAGALLGVGFQMFNETFATFGLAGGLPPWLSAFLPATLVLLIALTRVRRLAL